MLKSKICCAVSINLSGLSSKKSQASVNQLNKQLIESDHQKTDEQYLKLSSIVWIAAQINNESTVTIIDSTKPDKIIDTFTLGKAIIYAVGSVPGTRKYFCI